MRLQLGLGMDCHEGIFVSIADLEVGAAVAPDVDLLSGAPTSVLLAGDDVTVGAARHAGVQSHIQVPERVRARTTSVKQM